MNEDRAIRFDHEKSGGQFQMGVKTARVFNRAFSKDGTWEHSLPEANALAHFCESH